MHRKRSRLGAFVILLVAAGSWAVEDGAINGTWVSARGKSHIVIQPGAADTWTGTIVWIQEPDYPEGDPEAGRPRRDRENPDETLRKRPILGLEILQGFVHTKDNVWGKGTVYDPESGKTYRAKLTLKNPDTLHLRGYLGVSLFGRTTVWTRYHEEKPKEADEKP